MASHQSSITPGTDRDIVRRDEDLEMEDAMEAVGETAVRPLPEATEIAKIADLGEGSTALDVLPGAHETVARGYVLRSDFDYRTGAMALANVDLSGNDFTGQNLEGAQFNTALSLAGANFARTTLYGADFSGRNLDGAKFRDAHIGSDGGLNEIEMGTQKLGSGRKVDIIVNQVTHFNGASCIKGDFRDADLSSTVVLDKGIFDQANFSGAMMVGTSAKNARFVGANLSGAVMAEGDFRGANFSGANLTGADLRDTNLQLAIITPQTVFTAVIVDAGTKLPANAPAELIAKIEALRGPVETQPKVQEEESLADKLIRMRADADARRAAAAEQAQGN